jgi:hypothetical protein
MTIAPGVGVWGVCQRQVKLKDPKPLSCAGGVVRNGNCVCPAGFKTVKATPTAFRCVLMAPAVLSLPKGGKVLSLPKGKQRASSQKPPVLRLH